MAQRGVLRGGCGADPASATGSDAVLTVPKTLRAGTAAWQSAFWASVSLGLENSLFEADAFWW